MEKLNFFTKKDLIIIFVLFALSLMLFLFFSFYTKGQSKYVQIIYDGNIVDTLPIDKDIEYNPQSNNNIVIEIKDNKARFKTSDCPDKVCVNTGWLSSPGQTAVCLPNKVSIVIQTSAPDNNPVDTRI